MDSADIDGFTRRWRLLVLLAWVAMAALLLFDRWNAIRWFALVDTDDNLRMAQVRAWMDGQAWFDLRQYRLAPPEGADIHWSRLVDLPIAGIKLLLMPLLGGPVAERVAASIAPMLPMGVAMAAIAVTCRRLLSPKAFALGVAILLCANSARNMWLPLRLDHHGWQLAMLSLVMLALVDPRRARGGMLLGAATAVSLTIGLEMLLYLAAAGAVTALMWVRDEKEAPRLAAYGATLAGGCALGYLLFASNANRAPVCDALSPVWLSAMVAAGGIAVLLAWLSPREAWGRLAIGAAGGALIAAAFAWSWPHCLGRLEGVPPELEQLWLSRVREALPVYRHNLPTIMAVVSLPVVGLAGYAAMLWRVRRDPERLVPWAALAAIALLAASLLLWQSRAGPAAQLLAVPGAAALGWLIIPPLRARSGTLVRVFGTVAIFAIISGLGPQYAAQLVPDKTSNAMRAVNRANNRCPTLAALRPVALQPKGVVLTFVDLGPRLIAVTHHSAIAGPYHRNAEAIMDVMKAFRGSADNARRTIARRHVDYVLICPGLSESTVYASEAKKGFYMQLARGRAPAWLERVELPKDSPYRMWRVRR